MNRCLLTLAIAALAAGCGGSGAPAPGGRAALRLAAASNLNAALAELMPRFSAARNIDVNASYGSSGALFAQVAGGAPFDLFLSADLEYPKRLAERGAVVEDGTFTYAIGSLVVWVPGSAKLDPRHGGLRMLLNADARRIAVADPASAPYGRAAMAALQSEEIADTVQPKLVYGESVAQALQLAQGGAADVALVPLSLALAPNMKGGGRWAEVPAGAHPRIEQGGAIMRSTANVEAARAFRDYLTGGDGRAMLQQFGYGVPKQP